jgi:hypothetical protein
MADALIVYAAMACAGGCFKSPLRSARFRRQLQIGAAAAGVPANVASTTAKAAQSEVDAATAAVIAAAAAPVPGPCMGENVGARPPLLMPDPILPGLGAGKDALFKTKPLAGVRIGVYKEVRSSGGRRTREGGAALGKDEAAAEAGVAGGCRHGRTGRPPAGPAAPARARLERKESSTARFTSGAQRSLPPVAVV